MLTQLGAIPYILYWDLPCGWLNLVENLTKSGVSVRKNGLLTFSIPKKFKDAISKVYLHKTTKKT